MKQKTQEQGTRQLVWLPNDLFILTEIVRKRLGMSRSGFYRYAIIKLLQDLSILSIKAKDGLKKAVEQPKVITNIRKPEDSLIELFRKASRDKENSGALLGRGQ